MPREATVGQPLSSATARAPGTRPPWLPAAVVIGAAAVLLIGFLAFSGGDDGETTSGAASTAPAISAVESSLAPTSAPETSAASGTTLAGVPGEIFLEPATGVGPDPFTPSVDATPPELFQPAAGQPLAASAPFPSDPLPATAAPGTIQPIAANSPGLYGGTMSRTTCNKEQLVSFLEQNSEKAAAWAAVQQIQPSDIRTYVAGLTPVLLRTDTRVTNYGFKDGKAPARQVVLEAGTAVLVDEFGVPRARCYCGNPLREPEPEPTPTYTGDAWEGFDPAEVTVVAPSPEPIDELVVVDVASAEPFTRPTGSDGGADTPAPADALIEPTTTVAAPADITAQGSVGASSEFPGGEFPAALAVDGDPTTSWFSAGAGPDGTTMFGWVAPQSQPVQITSITIVSNAQHPEFPTDFGFGEMTIEILDADRNVVFTETVSLPGTPDPNVVVTPHTRGAFVELTFRGHEAPDCGGIAELIVEAAA